MTVTKFTGLLLIVVPILVNAGKWGRLVELPQYFFKVSDSQLACSDKLSERKGIGWIVSFPSLGKSS